MVVGKVAFAAAHFLGVLQAAVAAAAGDGPVGPVGGEKGCFSH